MLTITRYVNILCDLYSEQEEEPNPFLGPGILSDEQLKREHEEVRAQYIKDKEAEKMKSKLDGQNEDNIIVIPPSPPQSSAEIKENIPSADDTIHSNEDESVNKEEIADIMKRIEQDAEKREKIRKRKEEEAKRKKLQLENRRQQQQRRQQRKQNKRRHKQQQYQLQSVNEGFAAEYGGYNNGQQYYNDQQYNNDQQYYGDQQYNNQQYNKLQQEFGPALSQEDDKIVTEYMEAIKKEAQKLEAQKKEEKKHKHEAHPDAGHAGGDYYYGDVEKKELEELGSRITSNSLDGIVPGTRIMVGGSQGVEYWTAVRTDDGDGIVLTMDDGAGRIRNFKMAELAKNKLYLMKKNGNNNMKKNNGNGNNNMKKNHGNEKKIVKGFRPPPFNYNNQIVVDGEGILYRVRDDTYNIDTSQALIIPLNAKHGGERNVTFKHWIHSLPYN